MNLARALSVMAFLGLQSAFGAIIFQDDFNGNPTNTNSAPIGWTATDGTVDTLLNGAFGLPCLGATGACVDLDGSTSNSGILTSNMTFSLLEGNTYTLTFFLAGSQRGDTNTVTTSFGGQTLVTTLLSGDPYTQFSIVVTPVATLLNQAIVFENAGGDNFGLLLDSVALDEAGAAGVPEPSTLVLLGTALAAFGWKQSRSRR